jgi:hypothetical protein
MSWEDWIMRENGLSNNKTVFDVLCEMAVSSYYLTKKSRKEDLKDRMQFFILWWNTNKDKMYAYKTTTALGGLLHCDHSTILHHIHKRKPTIMYKKNTKCINDFLNS